MDFDPIKISREMRTDLEGRLAKASITLANELKEVLSVPAPRVKLNAKDGAVYYRAGWLLSKAQKLGKTGPVWHGRKLGPKIYDWGVAPTRQFRDVVYVPSFATKGAPPRKLSGRLRSSVSWEIDKDRLVAKVGTNVVYGRALEYRNHEWLLKTVRRLTPQLEAILGNPAGGVGQDLKGP